MGVLQFIMQVKQDLISAQGTATMEGKKSVILR